MMHLMRLLRRWRQIEVFGHSSPALTRFADLCLACRLLTCVKHISMESQPDISLCTCQKTWDCHPTLSASLSAAPMGAETLDIYGRNAIGMPFCASDLSQERDMLVASFILKDRFSLSFMATNTDLDFYEKGLAQHFELKIRGRIGKGCMGENEIKILNRFIKLEDSGLVYEADPRHTDLLAAGFGLQKCNGVSTPGVKDAEADHDMVKNDEKDHFQ